MYSSVESLILTFDFVVASDVYDGRNRRSTGTVTKKKGGGGVMAPQ